ncbi:hypothetical protein WJX72_001272 [[Myrmecia] bisecta]|uniref:E2 ubiquitin-conjugating enzyme n=1 Tax=[Myrmecia] bisecta TaxID=41462 RepID=A0AAW1P5P9_9CHLO
MAHELKMLQRDPPPGVCAWPKADRIDELEAQVQGPKNTVYEGGIFRLSIHLPARYPFEPPKVQFLTKVYHPNIDSGGRVCLDTLNMPPKGAWKPSLNIAAVLASIGLLLAEPNADDGLMTEITDEFKHNPELFDSKARQMTATHATDQASASLPRCQDADKVSRLGLKRPRPG